VTKNRPPRARTAHSTSDALPRLLATTRTLLFRVEAALLNILEAAATTPVRIKLSKPSDSPPPRPRLLLTIRARYSDPYLHLGVPAGTLHAVPCLALPTRTAPSASGPIPYPRVQRMRVAARSVGRVRTPASLGSGQLLFRFFFFSGGSIGSSGDLARVDRWGCLG